MLNHQIHLSAEGRTQGLCFGITLGIRGRNFPAVQPLQSLHLCISNWPRCPLKAWKQTNTIIAALLVTRHWGNLHYFPFKTYLTFLFLSFNSPKWSRNLFLFPQEQRVGPVTCGHPWRWNLLRGGCSLSILEEPQGWVSQGRDSLLSHEWWMKCQRHEFFPWFIP